jgi:hypothetical protein
MKSVLFWILWVFDVVVSASLYFLASGAIWQGGEAAAVWISLVAGVSVILAGGWMLRAKGHPWIAMGVLAILAVPAAGFFGFLGWELMTGRPFC